MTKKVVIDTAPSVSNSQSYETDVGSSRSTGHIQLVDLDMDETAGGELQRISEYVHDDAPNYARLYVEFPCWAGREVNTDSDSPVKKIVFLAKRELLELVASMDAFDNLFDQIGKIDSGRDVHHACLNAILSG